MTASTPTSSFGSADDWLRANLAQRLRRLGLLEDERTFPELDEADVPPAIQRTLLQVDSTRTAVRRWLDRDARALPHTTTELIVVLDQMRLEPSSAASLLGALTGPGYGETVARCALNLARNLHRDGRTRYAEANVDSSLNYMLEAQREFLFALSTGFLNAEEATEALGKYAVAVAFSSRWQKTSTTVLQRALRYHSLSIGSGNTSPVAYEYLVELKTALFDASSDEVHLHSAIELAEKRGLNLALSELLLKRGMLYRSQRTEASNPDFQRASVLSESVDPRNGVEYVQQALIKQLSLAAILGTTPLAAEEIRLPYGFLSNVARLPDTTVQELLSIVVDALVPMRDMLRQGGRPPNLAAQQVLFAVLRNSVSRRAPNSSSDAQLAAAVALEAKDRGGDRYLAYQYADALLALAEATPNALTIDAAIREAEELIGLYPLWPLPRVLLARSQSIVDPSKGTQTMDLKNANTAWLGVAQSIVHSVDYRRSDLGGRSNVFAIEDARGDLATALVFKPAVSPSDAEREARHIRLLTHAIAEHGAEQRITVPRSLGVVAGDAIGGTLHVIERRLGVMLSDLDPVTAPLHLEACVEFLALFHNATKGSPDPQRSAWGKLKRGLKHWSRSLFPDKESADDFIRSMRECLPVDLPLVTKRDAHASNWVVDSSGRVIAIDLEAGSLLPVGHDVAQLIEDCAILPVSDEGFKHRRDLMERYVAQLDIEVEPDSTVCGYEWFALLRAVWVASSASASKARHAHARQLARYLATYGCNNELRAVAQMLVVALRQAPVGEVGQVGPNHRRRSKRLAGILRHRAMSLGLNVDDGGFVSIAELAAVAELSPEEIQEVASHAAEPRFELDEGRIRALYGHSFPVSQLPDLDVDTPDYLFHGTSWKLLDVIASEGLRPMSRQKVHLTNNPTEALEVARRNSDAALLAIPTDGAGSLQAVADAVWAADSIDASLLEVRNPFAELAIPPAWLIET